jgi:hypothetical protein
MSIIYDSATGALSYDADGNGAGAAVQFASLSTGLSLTGSSFLVSGPANNVPVIGSRGPQPASPRTAPSPPSSIRRRPPTPDGDRITWALGGADAAAFTIDANGAVRLKAPADFETKASYSFSVIASDSGPTTATKPVTLTITDVSETSTTPIVNEIAGPNRQLRLCPADRPQHPARRPQSRTCPDATLPSLTIQGSISSSTDVDYYSITLQAGELLRLDVDGTNGLDSHLFVYYATQQLFGDNDDSDGPNDPDPTRRSITTPIRRSASARRRPAPIISRSYRSIRPASPPRPTGRTRSTSASARWARPRRSPGRMSTR